MKIFVTVLAATLMLVRGDVSHLPQSYNYPSQAPVVAHLLNQQLQHHHTSSQPAPPSSLAPLPYLPPVGQFQVQAPRPRPNPPAISYPMPVNFPVNFQTAPIHMQRRPRPRVRVQKKPVVTKNFFIHSAPEESDEEVQEELNQLAQNPRSHYNVLFVKTPAQTNRAAAINLAKTLKQEKTVVYVLAKKTTASDLQDAIAEAPQHVTKPEVFFIKYRTPEEAAHAQRQIQSQYDSLGGSSTITDEGVAPITSVVGSLDPQDDEEEEEQQHALTDSVPTQYHQNTNNNNQVHNLYLPANQF